MNCKASKNVALKKFPVIDIGRCSECYGCTEVAPDIFRYNVEAGIMDVIEQQVYPEDIVNEAIKNCPKDCISWDTVQVVITKD